MSPQTSHRLRRLRWQACAANPAAVLDIRRLLCSRTDLVEQILDRELSGMDVPGQVVHLRRLDLQVRARNLESLTTDLGQALESSLRQALDEAIPDRSIAGRNADISMQAHARELLLGYLVDGRPPWPWQHLSTEQCLAALREAALALAGETDACAAFPGTDGDARIIAFKRWLALLPPAKRHALRRRRPPAVPAAQAQAAVLERIGTAIHQGGSTPDLQALWMAWPAGPADDRWYDGLARWLPKALAGLTGQAGTDTASATLECLLSTLPMREDAAVDDSDGSHDDPPGRIVSNAGLVLLHPYLPRLFDTVGLLADVAPGPLPLERVPRALSLLHWLAANRDDAHELDLPFIKLLVGLQPDLPLPFDTPPVAEDDRKEAMALLEAVRNHWPALKGSDADTLRTAFLQRPGLLERRDSRWCLHLHNASFDVLLATLPWGLQWVKLPWMPEPLEVAWPTP